jgi:hypothetical protein
VSGSTDLYAVLGLRRSASQDDIAQAYRRLARTYHPDISQQPDAAERMRAINTAYAVLSDPARRAQYDAAVHFARPPYRSARPPAADRRSATKSGGTTRMVGLAALGIALLFVAAACVLTLRLPTRTGRDGVPVLPRATATALALEALSPAERTAVAATETSQVSTNAAVSPAVRNHPVLRTFSHPVLVPPASATPFDTLGSEPTRISGTTCDNDPVCVPRYVVDYGDQTRSGAEISGYAGRAIFDTELASAVAACRSETSCGATTSPGRPQVEYLRDFAVRGASATARRQACCPGPYVSVTWYDAATDTTYRLQLSGLAAVLGPDNTPTDLNSSASKLADLAGSLTTLR